MPDLDFQVETAEPVPYAAVPTLSFALHIANRLREENIHSISLRSQIQIEVTRRTYTTEDQKNLGDLFGEPARWNQTLRTMLWTHVSSVVPAFSGETKIPVQVPCSFDFNVAATKYFYGLSEGDIPLVFQFSGSVFYEVSEGVLSVAPISWDKEATFRLPVQSWRQMMNLYYPNSAWLCLGRDAFNLLYQYKVRNGIPTWEETVEKLFSAREETVLS